MHHTWIEMSQQRIEVIAGGTDELITSPMANSAPQTERGCAVCGVMLDPDTYITACDPFIPSDASSLFGIAR